MNPSESLKIALVGNPNIGKTTLFNKLCGTNQKTGNYPGVTVDKKAWTFTHKSIRVQITDLPGFNSLSPTSLDEELVRDFLLDASLNKKVDKVVFVVNATTLKKNLYLFTQVRDLGFDITLAINMLDVATKKGIEIDIEKLQNQLGISVVGVSAKKGEGITNLKDKILIKSILSPIKSSVFIKDDSLDELKEYCKLNNIDNLYTGFIKYAKDNLKVKLADLSTLTELSKGKEIQAFNITLISEFGAGFASNKKFITLIEKMILEFYEGIVQNMSNWNRPAPKLE